MAENATPTKPAVAGTSYDPILSVLSYMRVPKRRRYRAASATMLLVWNVFPVLRRWNYQARIIIPIGLATYLDQVGRFRRRFWESCVRLWMRRGVRIDFVAAGPVDSKLLSQWKALGSETPDKCYVWHQPTVNPEIKSIVETMLYFHPTLVTQTTPALSKEPAEALLWIEHHHSPTTPVAYDVEVVGPKLAKADDRRVRYQKTLDEVIDHSVRF